MADEWEQLKRDTDEEVRSINEQFQRWQLSTGKDPHYREQLREHIREAIMETELMIQDMAESIAIVEEHRSKFAFSDAEVDSRKRYISETNRTLSSINRALQQGGPASRSGGSGGSGSGGRAADRHALLGDGGQRRDTKDRLEAELVAENDAFLQQQEQAQREISSQRDLVLDDLSANITEIGEMGRAIGSELDTHIDILDGLNADAETTEGRIGRGMKRIGELIDKSSNTSVVIVIVILILILVGITAMLFV